MEHMPELSIVMPFYNKAKYVAEMIDSIIDSTYNDWELLLVDDGATADTLQFVMSHATDPHIRYIKRTDPPKGAQKCRNIGLAEAKGVFIVFFDSDDYITPQCLENRVSAIKSLPEADFVVFPSGTFQNHQFTPFNTRRPFGYEIYKDDLTAFLRKTLPFVVWSNIYRTKSLQSRLLTWDENILSLQDSDFNIHAILSGMKYAYAQTPPDYGYRIEDNPRSVTNDIVSPHHFDSHLYCLSKFYVSVQSRYGHHYDYSLYQGVLFIYNKLFSSGIQYQKARKLLDVTKKYSPVFGIIFGIQIFMTKVLGLFLPKQISFKIPLVVYTIRRWQVEHTSSKRARRLYKKIRGESHNGK